MAAEVIPIGEAQVSDAYYVHDQPSASATWTITHGLGKVPSVTIVDLSDNLMIGNISYPDDDTVVVTFSTALAGKAYLN